MLCSRVYVCLHLSWRIWESETVCWTEKFLGRAGREYVYVNVSVWTWLFILWLNVDSQEWKMTVFT
jgi:hypothetical protein